MSFSHWKRDIFSFLVILYRFNGLPILQINQEIYRILPSFLCAVFQWYFRVFCLYSLMMKFSSLPSFIFTQSVVSQTAGGTISGLLAMKSSTIWKNSHDSSIISWFGIMVYHFFSIPSIYFWFDRKYIFYLIWMTIPRLFFTTHFFKPKLKSTVKRG